MGCALICGPKLLFLPVRLSNKEQTSSHVRATAYDLFSSRSNWLACIIIGPACIIFGVPKIYSGILHFWILNMLKFNYYVCISLTKVISISGPKIAIVFLSPIEYICNINRGTWNRVEWLETSWATWQSRVGEEETCDRTGGGVWRWTTLLDSSHMGSC
jgi:hypothetical protein